MTTSNGESRRRSAGGDAGLVGVGVLMIGVAVGILTGEVAASVLAALGVGFLAMSLLGGMRGTRPAAGLAFSGCLFVGISLGLLLGNPAVGALGGLGVGFIVQYLLMRGGDRE